MAEHYDLLIRNGTCVLPWGEAAADVGVRRRADRGARRRGADATADETIDARGLHVLPGLIDPHVHLRDPGRCRRSRASRPARSAAVLGGSPRCSTCRTPRPSITDAQRAGLEAGLCRSKNAWCDMGLYVGGTKTNIADARRRWNSARGVCGIKSLRRQFDRRSDGGGRASLERVMRSGRRRIAYHSEDEYRLQARKRDVQAGDPYALHMEWRDVECAFLGTRRLMALARATGRPAHILHVSTAEELDYLKDFRDIATGEVLVNHLTQVAPDAYERLGGFAVMNPPIRDARHREAAWAAVRDGTVDTHRLRPRAASARGEAAAVAGLPGRADRRADAGAGHAGPRERRAAVAGAPGRSDVRRAGAGLWRGRQGAARRRLRRRLHARRYAARGGGSRKAGSSRPAAGRRSPACRSPAGRSRPSCAATAVMREDEVIGAPRGRLVRFR